MIDKAGIDKAGIDKAGSRAAVRSVAWCSLALLFTAPGPARADADALLRWGTLATLAPLCQLRDEGWAFDLRRAELQDATRSPQPDDAALRAAPGSDRAMAALSYAEAEALEDFAEAPPERTCRPLAGNPDLVRADEIVRAFRAQKSAGPGS